MKQPSDTLLVTIVQSDLLWENKAANLEKFSKQLASVNDKMEVVVLPEMFNTGFSMNVTQMFETMDGETVAWMKKTAAEKKIILTGSLIIKEDENYYNRLLWVLPNGSIGVYDKRHLFGYAGEDAQFSAGKKRLIASVKGWKINLLVCYDLRFPVWARQTVPLNALPDGSFVKADSSTDGSPEYDVLVYVANWPEKRVHAWKTLLQARAIENQCYVVGVNRTGEDVNGNSYSGDSMVVDPMGEIVQTAKNQEAIFTCALSLEKLNTVRQKLPFLKDADPFIVGS